MGRPAINPAKKKRTVSVTLTPEQCNLLRWSAAQTGKNTSVYLGELIDRDSKQLSKKLQKPLPNTDGQQMHLSADGQIEAIAAVRRLVGGGSRKRSKSPGPKTENSR